MYGGLDMVAGDGCESAKGAEGDFSEKVDGGRTVSLTVTAAHMPRSRQRQTASGDAAMPGEEVDSLSIRRDDDGCVEDGDRVDLASSLSR